MLTANQQDIDLGTLQYGKDYNFKYVITNSGDKIVQITKLHVGCGSCTKASIQKSILAPSESADLNVVFTPGSTGANIKNVSVAYTENEVLLPALILKFRAQVNG